ncbi:glycosyltransferase family 2 protein [Actinomycetospora atypica]|uniref:Glycosyltransferase family 2 protein n=1 Tax=Actinomycetospora atypica TaxID=1290095 RepID=A0ABV9YM96_9PSEU
MTPTVSVCVPVLQGAQDLAKTVRSVLMQAFTDIEVVVLAAPGAAVTADLDDDRVRVQHIEETLPVTTIWNRSVGASSAPLVKFLQPGDLLHPHCLAVQVSLLQAEPAAAFVAHRQHLIDRLGRTIAPARFLRGLLGVQERRHVARRVVRSGANPVGSTSGVLLRRSVFDAIGGFRRERFVADLDLYVRMTEHGPMLGLPDPLAAVRLGASPPDADTADRFFSLQRSSTREFGLIDGVTRVDRVVGALRAPGARRRREVASRLGRSARSSAVPG